jgi:hypothetical protein
MMDHCFDGSDPIIDYSVEVAKQAITNREKTYRNGPVKTSCGRIVIGR